VRTPQWQLELTRAETDEPRRRWWRRQSRRRAGERRTKGGRHAAPRRHRDAPIDLTRDAPIDLTRDVEPVEESEPRAIARSALGRDGGGRRVYALVAVCLGLLLAVLVPWQQLASAGAPDGQTPVAPQGTKGETTVLRDRSAAREAPRRLVQELTDLRQAMVVDLDESALVRLDEPGSPAAERDRELVAELRASGARYRGLRMTVRSVSLQSTSGDRAVVRTVVDESAYDVVGADGSRTSRSARRGQEVDLVLVWHDAAWRVRDVTAAPDRTD